jgi:hypothetical protein
MENFQLPSRTGNLTTNLSINNHLLNLIKRR